MSLEPGATLVRFEREAQAMSLLNHPHIELRLDNQLWPSQ